MDPVARVDAVTLREQIKCVEREISYRVHVYQRRIDGGKMTRTQADLEIARMKAVLVTLQDVEAKGRLL